MIGREIFNIIWPSYKISQGDQEKENTLFKKYEKALKCINDCNQKKSIEIYQKFLENSKYLFDEEKQRKVDIEKKATNILNSVAILSALIIGLIPFVLSQRLPIDSPFSFLFIIAFSSLAMIL